MSQIFVCLSLYIFLDSYDPPPAFHSDWSRSSDSIVLGCAGGVSLLRVENEVTTTKSWVISLKMSQDSCALNADGSLKDYQGCSPCIQLYSVRLSTTINRTKSQRNRILRLKNKMLTVWCGVLYGRNTVWYDIWNAETQLTASLLQNIVHVRHKMTVPLTSLAWVACLTQNRFTQNQFGCVRTCLNLPCAVSFVSLVCLHSSVLACLCTFVKYRYDFSVFYIYN